MEFAQKYVPNSAPVIESFWSNFPVGQTPLPNDTIEISCTVNDRNGDSVNAVFTSNHGSFSNQAQNDNTFTITFVVGADISGGQDVIVNVKALDGRGLATTQNLNIGTSSLGAQLTLISAKTDPMGRSECSDLTFKSNSRGFYQVVVLDDPGREFSSIGAGERPLYWYLAETDTPKTVRICGPMGTESGSYNLNESDPSDNEDRVFIIFRDSMDQETSLSQNYFVNILPGVSTTAVSGNIAFTVSIDGISAKGGGNVSNQGSFPVTERGLCWNTSGNPTISDSKDSDGAGTGVFSNVAITGLTQNTTYFVRAYATNAEGTAYGNQISFNSGWRFGTVLSGNYIFYNNGNGGGLVAAASDQGTGTVWSNITNINAGTSVEVGTSQQNTNNIISQPGHTSSAALICASYGAGWFLPSKDELTLMYQNLYLHGYGNFSTSAGYWSSSEQTASSAWIRYFSIGASVSGKGYSQGWVRAIRAF